jgi:hypothetical protein
MNKNTIKESNELIGKLIGVEIEHYPTGSCDRITMNNDRLDRGFVEIVGDGSLSYGGREVRVLTWVSAEGRIEDILDLQLNGNVDKKCGLHVHVDARHLGSNGLLSARDTYFRLTQMYRRIFKKLVPPSRKNNQFCRWVNNITHCPRNGRRYAAINFEAFGEHKTIEFRMQAGSLNVEKIENWALLCRFALNYVAKPENAVPTTWAQFLRILPASLRAYCIARRERCRVARAVAPAVALVA